MTTALMEQLNDNEYGLVVEALYALRERKQEALREVKQWPPGATFTARDFGIPQIDAILKRLDAEPAPEATEQPAASPVAPTGLSTALEQVPDGWRVTQERNPLGGKPAMRLLAPDGRAGLFGTFAEEVLVRDFLESFHSATPAPGQIGIRLEGGVIQSLWTDRPMDVVVIDYDTEGYEADEIFLMPQEGGGTSECIIREYAASVMPEECQRILTILDARDANAEDEPQGMAP